MFGWLTKFFRKKVKDDAEVYAPNERLIYSYWDGSKNAEVDPLVLYKRVMEHGPEISIAHKVARSIHPDARKAHTNIVDKIKMIFDVEEFKSVDGVRTGLTQTEIVLLLDKFLAYIFELKKNSPASPTWSPPSEESTPSSGGADQPIDSSADSGSTENGPATSGPEVSPMA